MSEGESNRLSALGIDGGIDSGSSGTTISAGTCFVTGICGSRGGGLVDGGRVFFRSLDWLYE